MSEEIGKEWFEEEEIGDYVHRTITYKTAKEGELAVVKKTLKIKVLNGLEYGQYRSKLIRTDIKDKDGEPSIDIKGGEAELIKLALGWSPSQIDSVKRNKPMSAWNAIVQAVSNINVARQGDHDKEKNGDGASSESPSQ